MSSKICNIKRYELSFEEKPCGVKHLLISNDDREHLKVEKHSGFRTLFARALKHKKKPELTHSSSSLWDVALNSDLLVPPELSVSTYTISFDASTTRLDQAAASMLQDYSTNRKSFTSKLVTGIKRSLSLHHLERSGTTTNRGDSRGFSVEQLNSRNTDTAGRILVRRRGSRTARLFHCIRPNTTLQNNGSAHLEQIEKSEFLHPKLSGVTADRRTSWSSCRHTASFPNSFEVPLRNSSRDRLVSSNSFTDCLSRMPDQLPQSHSTHSVQTDRWLWNQRTSLHCPTGYSLTCPGLISVGPVHSSLTGGRSHCFLLVGPVLSTRNSFILTPVQTGANLEARIFSAPSQLSRLRWIRSLRRTAKPNLENERHCENSLRLSILEARNLPSKRRYYCDICLDRTLYARTTSKTSSSGIFWAEDFDLNNLPNVSVMTISLYKEADVGSKELRRFGTNRMSAKKLRKTQNQLVGFITVPSSEISSRNDVQMWLTLQPPVDSSTRDLALFHLASVGTVPAAHNPIDDTIRSDAAGLLQASSSFTTLNGKQPTTSPNSSDQRCLPQIRIRARYRSVVVLPHRDYWTLKAFLLEHSLLLTGWLDTVLPVKTKEEVASSLVGLHECNGTLVDFLTDLVVSEVSQLDNDSMAFRSNTMATKAVECFVKLVGSTYLHNLLYRIVQKVLACLTAWEIDPEKLPACSLLTGSLTVSDTAAFAKSNEVDLPARPTPGSLKANQLQLLHYLNVVWRAIQASLPRFPSALIRVFSSLRSAIESLRGAEFCDNLISGCIFLRLICPALLSPSLFGLVSAFPSEPWCQRNLTLLAKSLQSLANFTAFDDKEPYMRFLNGYVSAQMPTMRSFIRNISNWSTASGRIDDPDTMEGFRDVIDEGFELANLHLLLTEHFTQVDGSTQSSQTVNGYNGVSPSAPDLPEPLSSLPCILEDLTKRVDSNIYETTGTTHSLNRYHHGNGHKPDGSDRLNSTLPSKHRRHGEVLNNTECLIRPLHSFDSTTPVVTEASTVASNMYAYHPNSLTNAIPYYTLHQNPGFHQPSNSDTGRVNGAQRVGAVSLLRPFAAGHPDCAGQPNPNDYDEPYAGVQSDSDRECDVQPQCKLNDLSNLSVPERVEKSGPSSSASDKGLRFTASTSPKKPRSLETSTAVALDEPIYDIVPMSDDSSTDEPADKNEAFLHCSEPIISVAPITVLSTQRPSLGALLTEDRSFKPVHLPAAEQTSLDSINSVEEISSSAHMQSDQPSAHNRRSVISTQRPSTIRLNSVHQNGLSPRLMPKQSDQHSSPGPSDSDAQSYPMPSAEYLQSEIVRLRQGNSNYPRRCCRRGESPKSTRDGVGSVASHAGNMRTKPVGSMSPASMRLEREQNELMREQVRIRARLAAARPTASASVTKMNTRLSSNPKMTNTPVRSPKLSPNSSSTNHLLTATTSRPSGMSLSNTGNNVAPCGPRIRHGPPPKPRDVASTRYAY
ncbi:putative Ras GTPase-activating protein [Fasciola gigantica]|uniref:Putative Ras GTPase-activating protein n=1 Tax=Fasciola gigantica TaxID=46835 RepID=A0A504YXN5_FASGI|nr:putative Ras GTPase-activating protein [Fasciola gigantica]